ncbi:helix-turn-helix transcriptional regulator [Pseudanabaena sp. FACHB-2040]|uniref:helix-turn-helix transcriptional regulator n=1 Tax=Pseudanabaena sp. FACHB-2040 TaxID=2692859 RepID=UPI001685A2C2|nr:helix-turn-helix transcriptional regulator [Pseudanabaena sp. FACHB-2040]MBD2256430.1 helix-turn-helix transcriptional regulator [Pseudanabaena sp. FACHB-2040]
MGKSERPTLADLRKEASLTQRQVADLLNVTVTTVGAWERGAQVPRLTFAHIQKLLEAFDCAIQDLVEATNQREGS